MIQNESNMWLSEQALNWEASCCGSSSTEPQNFFRAYELLQHAESLIITSINDFQLADGISNLKRALNQRLKYIDQLYSISTAFPKNFGFLECLHELGLARPFVIKQLLEVRNDIEHNDAPPPTRTRCLELLDIIWYLLKSTDSICDWQRSDIEYFSTDISIGTQYGFSISSHENKEREVKFFGWFPAAYISREEQAGYFQFHCEIAHTKDEKHLLNHDSDYQEYLANHMDKNNDDLWVAGRICLLPHQHKAVLRKLLSTTPNFS